MNNKNTYKNICTHHTGMPLFAQAWWIDLVCKEWDAAIAAKGDIVKGVWAYPIERKIGVALIRTPMLTPYFGPVVFFPKDIKESNKDSYEHEIITELISQVPDAPVWFMALQPGIKQAGLFQNAGLVPRVQQTFRISLLPDENILLANMKDTLRRNIRQAEKEVTISNEPKHIKELLDFYQHTLNRKKKTTPYSLQRLKAMIDACIANDAGALWVATEGEKIQAIVWQVWDAHCSYYLMGAQNPEANGYKAMSLLLWHSMKEAKRREISFFDLEGSMDEGVERFFRSFGGQRELYMVLTKNMSWVWRLKQLVVG